MLVIRDADRFSIRDITCEEAKAIAVVLSYVKGDGSRSLCEQFHRILGGRPPCDGYIVRLKDRCEVLYINEAGGQLSV